MDIFALYSLFFGQLASLDSYPEGTLGMSYVYLLSGILGLHLISLYCLLFVLLLVLLLCLGENISFRFWLFCKALNEQLRNDRWEVVGAAYCHMALVFAIMHLYYVFLFVSFFVFCCLFCLPCPFLFSFLFVFYLTFINLMA